MISINDLITGIDECQCGKQHKCYTDTVQVGNGILSTIYDCCAEYNDILLVADQNTYRVCGKNVEKYLKDKVSDCIVYQTENKPLIPNEKALAILNNAVSKKTELIIGVGSGVINDICKYTAFVNNIPYFIVATAPSMDGFASVGAALILKGMKVTLNANPPKAIFADTSVLKSAPLEMIKAGIGDILGKYSCLNDWRLSALINNEYFCQKIHDLVYDAADTVKMLIEKAVNRDENALGELMKALVAVGFYMSYVGNSRPASGSEHHLSHYFEITGILNNKPYFPHGIDVIYSAVVTSKLRKRILSLDPAPYYHNQAEWESKIREIYSTSADEVIKLQNKIGWYERNDYENVCAKMQSIKEILAEAPDESQMLDMVNRIGLDYNEFEKMYGDKRIENAVLYAKDLKDRYTVLWLSFLYFRENHKIDKSKIKLLAFDLDGTLTQHKSNLSSECKELLDKLGQKYKLLMVGAGMCRRIFNQMNQYPIDILGNYGMQFAIYHPEKHDIDIVYNVSLPSDRSSIEQRVTMLRNKYGFTEFSGDNVEYHDSGAFTFPLLGTKANLKDKLAFDPDRKKRRAIYEDVKKTFNDYIVFIGGSSSFDMAPAPYDKKHALERYCIDHCISHDEVVYVGDDYGPGGNDESIYKSDFNFIRIDNYLDFPNIIKQLL